MRLPINSLASLLYEAQGFLVAEKKISGYDINMDLVI